MARGILLVAITLGMPIAFVNAADEADPRPWPATYKIKPTETERLTAADVVGPDGIVYPDWRYAGVPGGIPDAPVAARIEDFGGKADDDADDSAAVEAGVRAVAKKGGGALVLGEGTYHLDRPVVITDDNIVIRGQGAGKTTVVFRYGVPAGKVVFFHPAPGAVLGYGERIDVHAAPGGLNLIRLECNGKVLGEKRRKAHWGGTYRLMVTTWKLVDQLGAGKHALKAVAAWDGGKKAEATLPVRIDPKRSVPVGRRRRPYAGLGAFTFCGDHFSYDRITLAKDGKRGDTRIELTDAKGLKPGDALFLRAPATKRWNRLVRNRCKWGSYRDYQFRVEKVEGMTIHLNQPLRYDFPTVDGSFGQKIAPIRRCGVEDLSIVQTRRLWTNGIVFDTAWACWVRGVRIQKAGRFPVYHVNAKWCEIRDCTFNDAMYHGGGGTAYVGWQHDWDCLMENVTTTKMRHAPCVQWAASGNVIRNSTFHGSDMQWHAGWTNENLFENCVVDAGSRSGKHGAWASPPEDSAHGPNGPRNVVYDCDLRSPRTGLWMGGMNEAWLILHNRFIVDRGPGVFAKTASFDHTIRGNVFVLKDKSAPMMELKTGDCVGLEVIGNRIVGGSGALVAGAARPLVAEGNAFAPAGADAPRPRPAVPSIFDWQRRGDRGDTPTWQVIPLTPFNDSINHARMKFRDRKPPYPVWPPDRIVRIAETLLAWQGRDGGWPKNQDWPRAWTDAELAKIRTRQAGRTGGTLDNRNVYTQVRYLAEVWRQTGEKRYAEGAKRGLAWIRRHQHPKSGGWRGSDVDAVTFNDDVMTGVLTLLRDVADSDPAYAWLDDDARADVKKAYDRGLRCVLDCQIRVDGRLTAWCQQHSHKDLRPVRARSFEPASIVSAESVGVVRFLMGIRAPSDRVRTAIRSAVAWFDRVKIVGLRWKTVDAKPQRFPYRYSTHDRVVVKDPAAPPIWTRFYDLRTEEPIFCTRGRKIVKDVARLSRERREGYAWYGRWPAALLERDYPAWLKKWAPRPSD